jgi:hypothetical protein
MMDQRAELTSVLRERLAIISDEASRALPEQHIDRLRENASRLEDLKAKMLGNVHDVQLAHYLTRGSYVKALEHLELTD